MFSGPEQQCSVMTCKALRDSQDFLWQLPVACVSCVESNESAADLYRFEHCEFLDGACFDCALASSLRLFSHCADDTQTFVSGLAVVLPLLFCGCVSSALMKKRYLVANNS